MEKTNDSDWRVFYVMILACILVFSAMVFALHWANTLKIVNDVVIQKNQQYSVWDSKTEVDYIIFTNIRLEGAVVSFSVERKHVSVKVRTDGRNYTSLSATYYLGTPTALVEATIWVPNESDQKLWKQWLAEQNSQEFRRILPPDKNTKENTK